LTARRQAEQELERAALKVRHFAALNVLQSPSPPPGWRVLADVVAPSEPVRLASERRARELLDDAA
jgi:hypothetical protein